MEIATNRAFTTFSYNGTKIGDFGDGGNYTDLGVTPAGEEPQCITELNSESQKFIDRMEPHLLVSVHAQNESMAAGTIFAISYQVRVFLVLIARTDLTYGEPVRHEGRYSRESRGLLRSS